MNRTKDKNKPKGAMSAYACFVQVIREEHKRKHPGEQVVFSDFSKKCAERWKEMVQYRAGVYVPVEKKPVVTVTNNLTTHEDVQDSKAGGTCPVPVCPPGDENGAEIDDEEDVEPEECEDE